MEIDNALAEKGGDTTTNAGPSSFHQKNHRSPIVSIYNTFLVRDTPILDLASRDGEKERRGFSGCKVWKESRDRRTCKFSSLKSFFFLYNKIFKEFSFRFKNLLSNDRFSEF